MPVLPDGGADWVLGDGMLLVLSVYETKRGLGNGVGADCIHKHCMTY